MADASNVLKTALVRKLRANIDHTNIPGLSEIPLVIQTRPTPFTPEPYIYIRIDEDPEVDKDKSSSSREYAVALELVVKSAHNSQSQLILDAVVKEVTRILDTEPGDYIDLVADGYNVYIQNVDNVPRSETEEDGATYFKATVLMSITIDFTGPVGTVLPIQAAAFSFAGFAIDPVNNRIEAGDSGTIAVTETYSSNNRGWDFVDTDVTQPLGAENFLTDNVYTVNATNTNINIGVSINYELEDDTTQTTSLNTSNVFTRGTFLRYGSIAAIGGARPVFTNDAVPNIGLLLLTNWEAQNRSIEIGTDIPQGQQITVQGQAGEYVYIIFGSSIGSLTTITQDVFDADVTSSFESVITTGGFKIYITTNPLTYDGDIIFNLN